MCTPKGSPENTDSELDGSSNDSDSDDSSADSESMEESSEDENSPAVADAVGSQDVAPGPSTSQEGEEEEENEIVKAFRRAKEVQRNHPPDITIEDFISDISFHPSNNVIAAGTILGDVLLYKYCNESCDLEATLEVHNKACRSLEFSLDGETLFTASKDKSIILSDIATGKMKRFTELAHDNPLYKLTVIDENRFATGDENGVVKVWDLRQQDALFSIKQMEDYVSDMITNESKRYLVCSSGEGTITTINLIDHKMHVQSELYEAELTSLGLIRHERKLLASSSKGRIYVFNWGDFGYHSDEFPGPKLAINSMLPLTENIVVTACEDGQIRATHLFPHQQLGIVGQHSFPVEQIDVSHDGELLASSSHDNTIKFWNIKYLEHIKVSDREKTDKKKVLSHNLPSSKVANPGDFFADLADT